MQDKESPTHELKRLLARVDSLLAQSDALSAAHASVLEELDRVMQAIDALSAELSDVLAH